jgi:hypothetical protein
MPPNSEFPWNAFLGALPPPVPGRIFSTQEYFDPAVANESSASALQRNVAIALGGGYSSGILATGAVKGAHYNCSPAPEPILK